MNEYYNWKFLPSCPYREKQYSIQKSSHIGHQALKKLIPQKQMEIKKRRINLSLQNSFEKLPQLPLDQIKQKYNYALPKFQYPEPQKILSFEEYKIILDSRIKENENLQKWKLPPLNIIQIDDEKFHLKRILSNKDLQKKLQEYQIQ